jgi:hypothetical protein
LHSLLILIVVRAQQPAYAVVKTVPAKTVAVMHSSAHVAQAAHVRVLQAVRRRVATKAVVMLLPNRVAVRKVNVQLNKTESNCTM